MSLLGNVAVMLCIDIKSTQRNSHICLLCLQLGNNVCIHTHWNVTRAPYSAPVIQFNGKTHLSNKVLTTSQQMLLIECLLHSMRKS